eukprot:COSAG06_NODE_21953_length_739_cov_1.523438_1_plen_77_part_10
MRLSKELALPPPPPPPISTAVTALRRPSMPPLSFGPALPSSCSSPAAASISCWRLRRATKACAGVVSCAIIFSSQAR